jgi:hypothetical protein
VTQQELDAIQTRCEAATTLIDEMHCERLAYSEYLVLRDSVDDVPDLLAAIAERDAEIERLREAQRWIPCSERMPELNKLVFLHDKFGKTVVGRHVENPYPIGYVKEFATHGIMFGFDEKAVTHWMPLPKLPEGVERDG